jgi:hypothetical protein
VVIILGLRANNPFIGIKPIYRTVVLSVIDLYTIVMCIFLFSVLRGAEAL